MEVSHGSFKNMLSFRRPSLPTATGATTLSLTTFGLTTLAILTLNTIKKFCRLYPVIISNALEVKVVILRIDMLTVVMLSVVGPNVALSNVVAPCQPSVVQESMFLNFFPS
jgi:hypothetical protein